MHLLRLGPPGRERPAVQVGDDDYVDLSDVVEDFDEAFFAGGGVALIHDAVAQRAADGPMVSREGRRIGAPIGRPHQILGIGLNYARSEDRTTPCTFRRHPARPIGRWSWGS